VFTISIIPIQKFITFGSVVSMYLTTKFNRYFKEREHNPDIRRDFKRVLSMHSKTTLQKCADIIIYKWVHICPLILLFCHWYVHISVKVFEHFYVYMKNSRDSYFISLERAFVKVKITENAAFW